MTASAIGAFLWLHYHRDWVDVCTFLGAGVYAIIKLMRRKEEWRLRSFSRHIMDGSAVFPLLMLSGSVLSRHLIEQLLSASRVTLSIAGVFALLAVLEDDKQA